MQLLVRYVHLTMVKLIHETTPTSRQRKFHKDFDRKRSAGKRKKIPHDAYSYPRDGL
jgi:hypothetical protein